MGMGIQQFVKGLESVFQIGRRRKLINSGNICKLSIIVSNWLSTIKSILTLSSAMKILPIFSNLTEKRPSRMWDWSSTRNLLLNLTEWGYLFQVHISSIFFQESTRKKMKFFWVCPLEMLCCSRFSSITYC